MKTILLSEKTIVLLRAKLTCNMKSSLMGCVASTNSVVVQKQGTCTILKILFSLSFSIFIEKNEFLSVGIRNDLDQGGKC